MANIIIRNGVEADRLSVTPAQGELLYITDTKKLFAGDGSTAGGNLIGPSGANGEKSVFIPMERTGNSGDFRVKSVGASSNTQVSFPVPEDFGSLVSIKMWGIITAVITNKNIDLTSDYASDGQDAQTHSESDVAFQVSSTLANSIFSYSVASVFNTLAAGDRAGIKVNHMALGATIHYLFVELKYTPT